MTEKEMLIEIIKDNLSMMTEDELMSVWDRTSSIIQRNHTIAELRKHIEEVYKREHKGGG